MLSDVQGRVVVGSGIFRYSFSVIFPRIEQLEIERLFSSRSVSAVEFDRFLHVCKLFSIK